MNPDTAVVSRPSHRAGRVIGVAIALALFAAAMWFAWLGWDHEYYEVDGVEQGPYRSWQVIGLGVSVLSAAVVAQLLARGIWSIFLLAAAADVGLAVPWALDAASTDDSGLWAVGLVFLLVGVGTGLTVVLAVTEALARRSPARSQR